MASNKELLFLTPGFAADESDSVCIPPLQQYLRALKKARPDWHIRVLALHYPYRKTSYSWHGIRVYPLGGANRGGFRKLLLWRKAARLLRKLHSERPVDLIHSLWLLEASWLAQNFAQARGIRHIATLQGQDALPGNRYLSRLSPESIQVAAISERGADQLRSTWNANPAITVIPWGIESAAIPPQIAEPNWDVLGVGSLVPVKQWALWIEVLALVRPHFPQLKAALIGKGPEQAQLEALIKAKGLSENVKLIGEVPRLKVLEKMAQTSVLLHSSRYEGQGYVFNEALARGMAIVSTPVGIAQVSAYWRVAPDAPGLAAALTDLLREPIPRISRSPYTIAQTVEEYARLYFP